MAPANPPKTLGIRHVALITPDLPRAERFYVEALGYRVEWRPDPDNVYLTRDGDNLALHRGAGGRGALDHFGIMLRRAEDVDAWAEHLRRLGAPIVKEPKTHRDGARSFYVADPDGVLIQFLHHPPTET
ncbi:MAG: VOC family protein [Elusimicrobia bacterium]|nr:VOC family protein [Elusimicrobiota bacterium]MDE2236529.1 VOC family protein [Elusimicrobiota bacterium]MDE2426421.1 VOC family protein [Elusimicrobiota bacterium]